MNTPLETPWKGQGDERKWKGKERASTCNKPIPSPCPDTTSTNARDDQILLSPTGTINDTLSSSSSGIFIPTIMEQLREKELGSFPLPPLEETRKRGRGRPAEWKPLWKRSTSQFIQLHPQDSELMSWAVTNNVAAFMPDPEPAYLGKDWCRMRSPCSQCEAFYKNNFWICSLSIFAGLKSGRSIDQSLLVSHKRYSNRCRVGVIYILSLVIAASFADGPTLKRLKSILSLTLAENEMKELDEERRKVEEWDRQTEWDREWADIQRAIRNDSMQPEMKGEEDIKEEQGEQG